MSSYLEHGDETVNQFRERMAKEPRPNHGERPGRMSWSAVASAKFPHRCDPGIIEYPCIRQGKETVFAFTSDEVITLKGPKENPYFSTHGTLTDFEHRIIDGCWSQLSFPIRGLDLRSLYVWPPEQPGPFDKPEQNDPEVTSTKVYSKQAYFFDDGESSLVTVGPSLPKVVRLKEGGAQFYVSSIGVISQGTGKYKGAEGISSYCGSAHFDNWPADEEKLFERLRESFKAMVSAYFKFVPLNAISSDHHPAPPPCRPSEVAKAAD
jgi:hypothetical protein